ncbi:MAG: hypothetical protein KGI38_05065 [Thaumarchaeota archaeon]|nr:hypothetical protein [Nitrososphaerota archaeon]
MKTTVQLMVGCSDATVRKKLASVLTPDNEGAPQGMKLSMAGAGRGLEFKIESGSPTSVLSTALAILRDVALFQEVWLLSQSKDARGHRA